MNLVNDRRFGFVFIYNNGNITPDGCPGFVGCLFDVATINTTDPAACATICSIDCHIAVNSASSYAFNTLCLDSIEAFCAIDIDGKRTVDNMMAAGDAVYFTAI